MAIILHIYENTNFHCLQPGQRVNIEFNILEKYVTRLLNQHPFFKRNALFKEL